MTFWILWGWDALIGLADGSVSSFNIALWLAILLALAGVMGGSLWLRSAGHRAAAVAVLLLLALPGLLFVLFFGALLVANPRWN